MGGKVTHSGWEGNSYDFLIIFEEQMNVIILIYQYYNIVKDFI